MIIDGHAHIFSSQVIARGISHEDLTAFLKLDTGAAPERTTVAALNRESSSASVAACLLLPTAPALEVVETNDAFLEMAAGDDFLITAGTLHPHYPGSGEELGRLHARGVRAIKLCSFFQRFSLSAPETEALFKQIAEAGSSTAPGVFVILDTFTKAHEYFGTPPEYVTTPALLANIVRSHRELNFVLAHMGGLAAPPEDIFRHLAPSDNLYLDTSVAAHTLAERDFLRLIELHGPGRVIFGTDWPWFGHEQELEFLDRLLTRAGCSPDEKSDILGGNIARLLGL